MGQKLFNTAVYANKATLVAADLVPIGDSAATTGGVANNKTSLLSGIAAFVAANGITLAGVAGVLTATAPAAGAGVGWTISASAAASGDTAGGDVLMVPGLKSGGGSDGKVIIRQPGGTPGADEGYLYTNVDSFRMELGSGRNYLKLVTHSNLQIATATATIVNVSAKNWAWSSEAVVGFSSAFDPGSGGIDAAFYRGAAATIQMGVDVNGPAVNQTFKAHNGITGTDVNAANLTIAGGVGTGAGTGGSVILSTPTTLGTGTTAQTLVPRLTLSKGVVTTDLCTATLSAIVTQITTASATGVDGYKISPTATGGMKTVVVDKTVSPSAVETAVFTVPAGSVIRSVQGNVESALTGGGTTVTWSLGIAADPDLYGTAGFPTQADSLAKNSKSNFVATAAQNAAAVPIILTGCATGGAADGDTALTVGSVRVVIIYETYEALANAA